jgi:hypothetical protein
MKYRSAYITPGLLAATFFLSTAPAARATSVQISDLQCGGIGGADQCVATNGIVTVTAYMLTGVQPVATLASNAWVSFTSAFDSWNESVSANWAIRTAPSNAILDVLTYKADVLTYKAFVGNDCGDPRCGGVQIEVGYDNNNTLPLPIEDVTNIRDFEAVWSQSILTTSKGVPSLPGNPYLDNPPGIPEANLGPPAYPFQENRSRFLTSPTASQTRSGLQMRGSHRSETTY